ncbi:MAG: Gfo/Idh/MocA family oxidoreductase [Melioribacteraceae bacterium]|nr:Gfo/Idh/MocA family oxidoreductase [Melioribacteraceae bacterium]
MKNNRFTRRDFIKKTGTAAAGLLAAPYFIPSNVLGRNGFISPGNKITIGIIGAGWMGTSNLESFLNEDSAQVVAICDIDKEHLTEAVQMVNSKYGNNDCSTYHDFNELLARKDIDAVVISTPDHWHAIPAIAAAKAGKDIYAEKPLSHSFNEGVAMRDAVHRYGRIWQTGSWQRSISNFRFACEIVRNGKIGKVNRVEVGLPFGHKDFEGTGGEEAPILPPAHLDYDRWLGPAPFAQYAPARVHKNWRWHLDYGGGQLMDWIGHHNDIAHWALDLDSTGPIEVDAFGEYPKTGLWNTATKFHVKSTYKNGIEIIIAGGHENICDGKTGTKWFGEEGWVHVDRGFLDASPKSLLKDIYGPNDIRLYKSPGHAKNFLDCVKSRTKTLTPVEVAHRSATPGHLGQISMLLKRKIKFDPDTEKIMGDELASSMLGRSYRSPWVL